MNITEQLQAELRSLGVEVDAELQAAWVGMVERVGAELAGPVAASPGFRPASPAGSASGAGVGRADDSAWTWRAEPPLPPTGHGVLDGVRLGVKDLLAVAGRPLGAGSAVFGAAGPEQADAPVVAALRAAGAVLVGTTKLHEFAFGVTGINAWDGTAANPAAPGCVPGGSSSGSAAAVAAGEADVALGTDTGGSCRIPAACCAVVGVKPRYRAVDVAGVFPLAPSLDHVGWLAVDVVTARRVAEVLGVVPPHAADGAASGGGRPAGRLGVHRAAVAAADDDVAAAFTRAAEALGRAGWDLVDVDWPGGEETFAVSTAIMFTEAAFVHRDLLAQAASRYGADVRARLVQGRLYDLATYLQARQRQEALRARCLHLLAGVDAVVGPTLAIAPPPVDRAADPAVAARLVANTRLANLTGLPAISVPVPGHEIPVGMQIEAASDDMAFRVAAAAEAVLRPRP